MITKSAFLRKLLSLFALVMLVYGFVAVSGSACAQITLPAYDYINTVAGNGTGGYAGDNGLATNAEIKVVNGMAVDAYGNIYIADSSNNRIRKVNSATGIITTVAGNGSSGYNGDGIQAISAELNNPNGVAVDGYGNIYIADTSNYRIRKVTVSTGIITTVAGEGVTGLGCIFNNYNGDNQQATSAYLDNPTGVAVDTSGNIYIADTCNNRIRKVTASTGIITTVAGNGSKGYNGDLILATGAELYWPVSVTLDGYGNIYIADNQNNRVREVIVSTGIITTLAGTGLAGFTGDGGLAIVADLNNPSGVASDQSGNVYIADRYNNRIRVVSNGNIKTFAGTGNVKSLFCWSNYTGDGILATNAPLSCPESVAIDMNENVYIADTNNYRIRVVGGELTQNIFNPLYKVVSILYSPPGNQSTQGYGTSTTDGTTTTIGSTFTFGNSFSYTSGPLIGILDFSIGGSFGNSTSYNNSYAFTENLVNATTITTGDNSTSMYNPTDSDAVNHNLDTFEIWLNPLVTIETNGTTPVFYTVSAQPTTVNGVTVPFADLVGVPAITMEATPAGITALNPSGIAGITTVPVNLLVPQAIAQNSGVNAYLPGLGAICANNTYYQQQLAADLAAEARGTNNTTQYCTQANQCGCTPADFVGILQTNPLLNYSSVTYTANPYAGTSSPLQANASPVTICGLNAVPTTADCRYVVVPSPGTNTPETATENAVPMTELLEGGIQSPAITLTDSTTTAETIGGSTSLSTSFTYGGTFLLGSIKVTDTWTWTDSESVGNSYGSANSMAVTLKSSTTACDEDVSIFEDTVYHTFVFQVPADIQNCQ